MRSLFEKYLLAPPLFPFKPPPRSVPCCLGFRDVLSFSLLKDWLMIFPFQGFPRGPL